MPSLLYLVNIFFYFDPCFRWLILQMSRQVSLTEKRSTLLAPICPNNSTLDLLD